MKKIAPRGYLPTIKVNNQIRELRRTVVILLIGLTVMLALGVYGYTSLTNQCVRELKSLSK